MTIPPPLSTGNLARLADREIHVYYAWSSRITDRPLLTRYRKLLSEDERGRLDRFVFEKDRHRFAVAHALLRTTLSRHAAVEPEDWTFATNSFGKPHVTSPPRYSFLRFNLSHAGDICACALTAHHDLGLDVEEVDRLKDLKIAASVCCEEELFELTSLPPEVQRTRFFEYWTLKEAYVKARGVGLSVPLNECCFELEGNERASLRFASPGDDTPSGWQFRRLDLSPEYRAAVAIRLAETAPCRIRATEVVPLGPSP